MSKEFAREAAFADLVSPQRFPACPKFPCKVSLTVTNPCPFFDKSDGYVGSLNAHKFSLNKLTCHKYEAYNSITPSNHERQLKRHSKKCHPPRNWSLP